MAKCIPGEVVEEKISLSERFSAQGELLSLQPGRVPAHHRDRAGALRRAEAGDRGRVAAALVWALERGSRSGRVAYQFARDYAGRHHA
jgi:predicted AAA+ superfamily ATPase